MKSTVVTSSPDVMGGTPVFAGTRVPIENLLDSLEGGESIEDFLEGFPSVTREQVITFLEETKARVLAETESVPGAAPIQDALDAFIGRWSETDEKSLLQSIESCEMVDEALWK